MKAQRHRFSRWRWWQALAAVLAAVAITLLASGGEAFATTWIPEEAGGSQVYSNGPASEAYNGGNHLDVWLGHTDDNVWFSYNNGNAFQVGDTATNVAPTVVALGDGNFAVFNVGTNNNVYWTYTSGGNPGQPGSWVSWRQVTATDGVQTGLPVAVTQLGPNSDELYMVWRGNGSDTQLYGSYFNGTWWSTVQNIGGATGFQPSITWNPAGQAIWVTVRGENGAIWLNSQNYGSSQWNGWYEMAGGPQNGTSPSIQTEYIYNAGDDSFSDDSYCMDVAATDGSGHVFYEGISTSNNYGREFNLMGWTEDPGGYQTTYGVNQSSPQASGSGAVYALINGLGGDDWWSTVLEGGGCG
jgi:hypothetical protein